MVNTVSLNAYSYNTHFASNSAANKLFVPVAPAMVIYTQFDHVAGVAATQGQSGISVSKIKILNTLIEQLVSMRHNATIKKAPAPVSDAEMDTRIKNYQNEIKSLIKQAEYNPYILPAATPQSGAIFSLNA